MTLKEMGERVTEQNKHSLTRVILTKEEWDDYFFAVLPEIKNEYVQGNKVLYYKGLPVLCDEWK